MTIVLLPKPSFMTHFSKAEYDAIRALESWSFPKKLERFCNDYSN